MTTKDELGVETDRCPAWCVTDHGRHPGEDDWLHVSASVTAIGGVVIRRQMSIDPRTGSVDGPYVVLGETELTREEARAVGEVLVRLARTA